MTGWGKAVCELPGKKLTIEIKSLNSKQLDLSVRMPSAFKDKELELRNIISEKLLRGKVDLTIMMEQTSKQNSAVINADVLKQYHHQLKKIAEELDIPLLGQIPLVQSIRECGDAGKPAAVDKNSVMYLAFKELAQRVVERVDIRNSTMEATKKVNMVK